MENSGRRTLVKRIGNVVAVAAMTFIIVRLYNYRQQISDIWNSSVALVMVITIIICALLVVLSSAMYLLLTRAGTGLQLRSDTIIPLYVKSNLYKYLPGNVMHYIGRNQIAEETDASHPQIAMCTILEMGASCIGGALVGIIFSFRFVMDWLNEHTSIIPVAVGLIVMICIAVLITGMICYRKPNARDRIHQIINKKSMLLLAGCTGYYFLNQLLQGILFIKLLQTMGANIPSEYFFPVAGVYAFAWLVGFVTPGAPGGLGVREAMLAVFLNGMVTSSIITTAAVLNRIITIMGDVLAAAIVCILYRRRSTK